MKPTTPGPASKPSPQSGLPRVQAALRLVCSSMPHLAGLANAVRLFLDDRIPTAGITAGGRLLVNPTWFDALDISDGAFIMAHELFHLCLRTHERGEGTDAELFNWAHDYVINDMLREEMGREIPAGGLDHKGARKLSAEQIVRMLKDNRLPGPKPGPRSPMQIAMEEAGIIPPQSKKFGPGTGDVLTGDDAKDLFPDLNPRQEESQRRRIRVAAARSAGLGVLKDRLDELERQRPPVEGDIQESLPGMLKSFYRPPWEMALQQWLEAVAPGPRSFARPSRRGAERTDVVLPGRRREGWTLHIVLDTSGSMTYEIPRILGTIACFCESVSVTQIHVLQCDTQVTHDDFVDPEELSRYSVAGGGGSDMSPAMLHLARDPEVEAVIVLTDGAIEYPRQSPPYQTLWALTESYGFNPPYGQVLVMPRPT